MILDAAVETTPLPTDDGRPLGLADFALGVTWALLLNDFGALATALAQAEQGDGTALMALADVIAGRSADGTYDSLGQPLAVICSDMPVPEDYTKAAIVAFADQLETTQQLGMVRLALEPLGCLYWPHPGAAASLAAPEAPPLLVIAGLHDPLFPYGHSEAVVEALANGSHLLTHEGGAGRGALKNLCVLKAVEDFMIDPNRPPIASCGAGD